MEKTTNEIIRITSSNSLGDQLSMDEDRESTKLANSIRKSDAHIKSVRSSFRDLFFSPKGGTGSPCPQKHISKFAQRKSSSGSNSKQSEEKSSIKNIQSNAHTSQEGNLKKNGILGTNNSVESFEPKRIEDISSRDSNDKKEEDGADGNVFLYIDTSSHGEHHHIGIKYILSGELKIYFEF